MTKYTRCAHGRFEHGGTFTVESWDVIQDWSGSRPAGVPPDAEKHHGYIGSDGRQHVVFTRQTREEP